MLKTLMLFFVDGRAIFVYFNSSSQHSGALKVAQCGDVACSSADVQVLSMFFVQTLLCVFCFSKHNVFVASMNVNGYGRDSDLAFGKFLK
jgi:hypothetical protein